MNKVTGWEIRETIAMSIPNPLSVVRILKPDWMSQEQFEAFVKELEFRHQQDTENAPVTQLVE